MCVQMVAKVERLRLEGLETVLPDDCQQVRCDDDAPVVIDIDGPELAANTRSAIAFCQANTRWNLSLQTHKILSIR